MARDRMEGVDDLEALFREEAEELLADFESCVLELEHRPDDPELISQAFRLLHTVKGSGGMYGFEEVVALAHEVEAVFDLARQGAIQVTAEVIAVALRAKDGLRELIDRGSSPSETDDGIRDALRSLPDLAASREAPISPEQSQATSVYDIRLAPGADALRRGVRPLGVLDELRSLGDCEVTADLGGLPGLEEMDPERCWLGWDVVLRTPEPEERVREALMFLGDDEAAVRRREAPAVDVARSQEAPATASRSGAVVRVAAPKLDRLVDLVGELVTAQGAIAGVASRWEDPELLLVAEQIERLTAEMRASVLDIRMVPVGTIFGRFRRHVRDLAAALGKQADVETIGGETELDKTVIDRIEEPLLHLVRNSLDHGVELPDERRRAGKAERAVIRLAAWQAGGSVFVSLSDDGRGVDVDAVRAKGAANGLLPADADERAAFDLLFRSGFSTSADVTSLSGRGVGLDAVKRTAEELHGCATLDSVPGGGTTVTLQLPLTLAILEGLLVGSGDERYVVPLSLIEECVDLAQDDEWRRHGRDLMRIAGGVLPFVRLRDFFGIAGESADREFAVVVSVNGRRLGLVVDRIEDRFETVIKTLGRAVRRAEGVSGATVLGDGSVALIVDTAELLRHVDAADLACEGVR